MTPSKETRRAEGRGQPEGSPREEAGVRTQSGVALPSNLARVNAAARRAVQTRSQNRRLTRKPTALRQESWRLMHARICEGESRMAELLDRAIGRIEGGMAMLALIRPHLRLIGPSGRTYLPNGRYLKVMTALAGRVSTTTT